MIAESQLGPSVLALGQLAATTLAVNVAYLALNRFRYRDQIRRASQEEMQMLGGSDLPEHIKSMDLFAELAALCNLSDPDVDAAPRQNAAPLPHSLWAWWYKKVLSKNRDRQLAWICAFVGLLVIWAGALHGIGYIVAVEDLFFSRWSRSWFWVLTLGVVAPSIAAIAGRQVEVHAKKHAKKCRQDLARAIKQDAQEFQVPKEPVQQ